MGFATPAVLLHQIGSIWPKSWLEFCEVILSRALRRTADRAVIVDLDSSVLLRIILRQRNALKEWKDIEQGVGSALLEIECLRTLDRLRLIEQLRDDVIAARREAAYRLIEAVEVVDLTHPVLTRAAQPFPTVLGTLDAIHLVTALMWREQMGQDLVMATHDVALGTAARASGLRVIGV